MTNDVAKGLKIEQFKGYLFDIDGVVCLGNTPIPGVAEVLRTLQHRKKKLMFVSNTTSRSVKRVVTMLADMGVHVDDEDILLASEETAKLLSDTKPGANIRLLGSDGLKEILVRHGLHIVPDDHQVPSEIDYVVVGKDTGLTYSRLTWALRSLIEGALFVAINEDLTVPTSDGLEPGAGAITQSIAAMTGRKPDISIGKPGPLLFEKALEHASLKPHECLMVGDTLEADIVAAQKIGIPAALVMTGNAGVLGEVLGTVAKSNLASHERFNKDDPRWVIASVAELLG